MIGAAAINEMVNISLIGNFLLEIISFMKYNVI